MKTIKNSISFYNKFSTAYGLCLDWIFDPGRKKVASILNRKIDLDILEIGSGTGRFVQFLKNNNSYLGIEGAEEMYKLSKLKYAEHAFENSRYEDYQPSIKYKAIVINYTLSVVDDPHDLIKKVSGWLTDDGKVYIVNHFSADNLFYKILQKLSIYIGYNAYFPFNPKLFSEYFNITIFESVNLMGGWKFIELTPKNNE